MTTFQIENVTNLNREDVTEEQWKKIQNVFPGWFRKVERPTENYSDEAKKIINKAGSEEE